MRKAKLLLPNQEQQLTVWGLVQFQDDNNSSENAAFPSPSLYQFHRRKNSFVNFCRLPLIGLKNILRCVLVAGDLSAIGLVTNTSNNRNFDRSVKRTLTILVNIGPETIKRFLFDLPRTIQVWSILIQLINI